MGWPHELPNEPVGVDPAIFFDLVYASITTEDKDMSPDSPFSHVTSRELMLNGPEKYHSTASDQEE